MLWDWPGGSELVTVSGVGAGGKRKTRLLAGLVRDGLGLLLLLPTRLVFSAPQATGQPVPDDPHQASLTAR